MIKKFDIDKLPDKVTQLNEVILERLTHIVGQYEIYAKLDESIPKELDKANNNLNRLLGKRIGLIKRYAKSDIKLSNFSEMLVILATFPQEIQYMLYRRRELIEDRRMIRRYIAHTNSRNKHLELEEKRKVISVSISEMNITELDKLIQFIGDVK